MLRGEILPPSPPGTPSSTFRFSRTQGTTLSCSSPLATIQAISWERIRFPTGSSVQSFTVTLPDNTASTSQTLPRSVDPTRTLVFASNQTHGGQAGGETSLRNKNEGSAAARLVLSSPTQVDITRDSALGDTSLTFYVVELAP
jgi:hypothetical protein